MKFYNYKADKTCGMIYELSRKYLASPILDVGAGSGALLKLLKDRAYKATGIDIQSSCNDVLIVDAVNMSYEDDYQTIIMADFLEHVEDIGKVLDNAYRALRDGGYLIVISPFNEDMSKNMTQCPQCGKEFHRNYHYHSFTDLTLAEHLTKAGFEIVKTRVVLMLKNRVLGFPFTMLTQKMGKVNSLFMVGRK